MKCFSFVYFFSNSLLGHWSKLNLSQWVPQLDKLSFLDIGLLRQAKNSVDIDRSGG